MVLHGQGGCGQFVGLALGKFNSLLITSTDLFSELTHQEYAGKWYHVHTINICDLFMGRGIQNCEDKISRICICACVPDRIRRICLGILPAIQPYICLIDWEVRQGYPRLVLPP